MRVPDGFPPEILGPWCCPYAGSRRVPSRSFGSMTLSLCGFPTGSLQKFWVHDVVLMRVPDGFPPEVLGPWRCPYAGSRRVPSTSFGSGSLQKFGVHDVVLMRVPSRFPPEVLGSRRCPHAGSQPVPSRNFGFMTLSLCRFPAGSFQKFWVHDVVLMRVPSRFPPEILGPWCCPYAGSQPVPSRNFGVLMRVPSGFPLAPDDGSSPNLRSLWSSDKKVSELAKLTKMHNCGTRASLSPCKCPYFSLPTPHDSATTPQQENVKFIQNWSCFMAAH